MSALRVQRMMCRIAMFCGVLLVGCFMAGASADDRVRVAVVDFDTEALNSQWRWGWSHQNLERAAADNLASQLVKTGRFRVVERQQLDAVLAEQRLGGSGRIDPSTAARIGKILGVQVVIIGSVTEFGIKEMGGKVPQIGKWKWGRGVGAQVVRGESSLAARMVDTSTAEILGAYEGSGSHTFAKGEFAGANLGTRWDSGTASKVLAEAVEEVAEEIAAAAGSLDLPGTREGLEAKIAKVEPGRVYLNIGRDSGLRPGDLFEIHAVGEEINDPDTGESLGGVETVIGVVRITSVINDRLSVAAVVSGKGFEVGDRAVMQ